MSIPVDEQGLRMFKAVQGERPNHDDAGDDDEDDEQDN